MTHARLFAQPTLQRIFNPSIQLIFVAVLVLLAHTTGAQTTCNLTLARAAESSCHIDCCGTATCSCSIGSTPLGSGGGGVIGLRRNITYATVCQYDRCVLNGLKGTGCHLSPEYAAEYLATLERKSKCDNDIVRLGCDSLSFARLYSCFAQRFSCGDISACTPRCYSESIKCLAESPCIPSSVTTAVQLCRQSLFADALQCDACNLPNPMDPATVNATAPPTCQSHFLRCESALQLLPADYSIFAASTRTPSPNGPGGGGDDDSSNSTKIYIVGGAVGGALIALGFFVVLAMFIRRRNLDASGESVSGGRATAAEVDSGAGGGLTEPTPTDASRRYRRGSSPRADSAGRRRLSRGGGASGRKQPPSAWSSLHDSTGGAPLAAAARAQAAAPQLRASDSSSFEGPQKKHAQRGDDAGGAALSAPQHAIVDILSTPHSSENEAAPDATRRGAADALEVVDVHNEIGFGSQSPKQRPVITVAGSSVDGAAAARDGPLSSPSHQRRRVPPGAGHHRTNSQTSGFNASLNELDLNFSTTSEVSTLPAASSAVDRRGFQSHQQHHQQQHLQPHSRSGRKDDASRDGGNGGSSTSSGSSCDEGSHVPEAPVLRSLTATPTVMQERDILRHIKMNAYRRGARLGKGADGVVLEVTFPNGFSVAVKEVPMHGKSTAEIREIAMGHKAFMKLDHPNVCKLHTITYDAESENLQFWMEMLSGGPLDKLAKKRAQAAATEIDFSMGSAATGAAAPTGSGGAGVPLPGTIPEPQLAEYAAQVIDGLMYLHDQGIVHRDIKGSNLIASRDRSLVKIVDFGSARVIAGDSAPPVLVVPPGAIDEATAQTPLQRRPSDADAAAGTALWLAPEIRQSTSVPPTFANDVWSFGVTVAELANRGNPPWPASFYENPWSAMFQITATGMQPLMPPGASPELEDFLSQCWKVEPRQRATLRALRDHPWITKNAPTVPRRQGKPVLSRVGSGTEGAGVRTPMTAARSVRQQGVTGGVSSPIHARSPVPQPNFGCSSVTQAPISAGNASNANNAMQVEDM